MFRQQNSAFILRPGNFNKKVVETPSQIMVTSWHSRTVLVQILFGNHGRPASLTSASGFTTRDMKMNGSKEQRCEIDVPGMIPCVWTCDHLGGQIGWLDSDAQNLHKSHLWSQDAFRGPIQAVSKAALTKRWCGFKTRQRPEEVLHAESWRASLFRTGAR